MHAAGIVDKREREDDKIGKFRRAGVGLFGLGHRSDGPRGALACVYGLRPRERAEAAMLSISWG
jgi:hypothetical protein